MASGPKGSQSHVGQWGQAWEDDKPGCMWWLTHLPWSGVRCSMEDTFNKVLWSRSWARTLRSSTMERFMCQAKLPGRSISSTGIRQMP